MEAREPRGEEAQDPGREEHPKQALANSLLSLANPTRLDLLHELRSPKTLGEIRLHALQNRGPGLSPGRVMSRQAVRHHLDILLVAGFVRAQERKRDGALVEEYVVNHRQLFALSEEVRVLANLRPDELHASTVTIPLQEAQRRFRAARPALVMVHGLNEGTSFPLLPRPARGGGAAKNGHGGASWIIGRRADADVVLDHDPYISSDNTVIGRDESGAHWVEDHSRSRNGTTLNWTALQKGDRAELKDGDIVGLGRTLLMFRA